MAELRRVEGVSEERVTYKDATQVQVGGRQRGSRRAVPFPFSTAGL